MVDLSFACFFNLVSDYKDNNPVTYYSGKIISGFFVSSIIVLYMRLGEMGLYTPQKFKMFESQLITDNLHFETVEKSFNVRLINVIFRLKIIFLMACIIMLQNWLYACLGLMMAT